MQLSSSIDGESVLTLSMLIIGVLGFIGSFQFSNSVALFPQLSTAVIIVGCILLLAENYLPESLSVIISRDRRLIADEEQLQETQQESPSTISTIHTRIDIDNRIFLVILMLIYIVSGTLIGLLWVTPLFVIAYTINMRQPWYIIGGLSAFAFIISYSFLTVLNLPLASGILIEGL